MGAKPVHLCAVVGQVMRRYRQSRPNRTGPTSLRRGHPEDLDVVLVTGGTGFVGAVFGVAGLVGGLGPELERVDPCDGAVVGRCKGTEPVTGSMEGRHGTSSWIGVAVRASVRIEVSE